MANEPNANAIATANANAGTSFFITFNWPSQAIWGQGTVTYFSRAALTPRLNDCEQAVTKARRGAKRLEKRRGFQSAHAKSVMWTPRESRSRLLGQRLLRRTEEIWGAVAAALRRRRGRGGHPCGTAGRGPWAF